MATPLIVPVGLSATMPTRLQLRRALGEALGTWVEVTVDGTPSGGEAGRWVMVSSLRDDEAARDELAGSYVYPRTGAYLGIPRRLQSTGYEGPLGALRLATPYAANLAVPTTLELTSPLPVDTYLTIPGLNQMLNDGLALARVEARITLTGNGTRSVSLISYPWLRTDGQIVGIYDRRWGVPTDQPLLLSGIPFTLRTDGPNLTLETGQTFTSGETFELGVIVAADRLTYDGSAWGYAQAGLSADTDQAAVPLDWGVTFGMVRCLQFLRNYARTSRALSDAERQAILADVADRLPVYAGAAVRLKQHAFPKPAPASTPPLVGMPAPVGYA